jgi:hypothetical protein
MGMFVFDDFLRHRDGAIFSAALCLMLPTDAFAGHPLATEDSGVQGRNNVQFELSVDRAVDRSSRLTSQSVNATFTYGLADALDVAFSAPWLRNQLSENTGEFQRGVGDASIFLKWRNYQDGKLSLALKPILTLPTGDSGKGLGNDRLYPGMTGVLGWGGDRVSLSANIGYTFNDNKVGDRKDIWSSSFSAAMVLANRLSGVAELGSYRNNNAGSRKNPVFATVGLVFHPSDKLDLDIGYRNLLLDSRRQCSIGAGIAVRR